MPPRASVPERRTDLNRINEKGQSSESRSNASPNRGTSGPEHRLHRRAAIGHLARRYARCPDRRSRLPDDPRLGSFGSWWTTQDPEMKRAAFVIGAIPFLMLVGAGTAQAGTHHTSNTPSWPAGGSHSAPATTLHSSYPAPKGAKPCATASPSSSPTSPGSPSNSPSPVSSSTPAGVPSPSSSSPAPSSSVSTSVSSSVGTPIHTSLPTPPTVLANTGTPVGTQLKILSLLLSSGLLCLGMDWLLRRKFRR